MKEISLRIIDECLQTQTYFERITQSIVGDKDPTFEDSWDDKLTSCSQKTEESVEVMKTEGSAARTIKPQVDEDFNALGLTQEARFIRETQDTPPNVEHNIVYNDKNQVKGGTLDALVERLTSYGSTDLTFTQTFLLTFKTFTTAEEFFGKLMQRYIPHKCLSKTDSIFPLHTD